MELAKGGELFDKLLEQGSLSEQEAGRLMAQVGHRHPPSPPSLNILHSGSRGPS